MSLNKTMAVAVFAVCVLTTSCNHDSLHHTDVDAQIKSELAYYEQAAALNDLLFREGVAVNTRVVVTMLKEIDKNVAKYYPNGPFTRNDFIALGWLESEFRQYERGTHGERGIFQVMPCEFKDYNIHKNYYNVDVNTEIAFRVLDTKFRKHEDYKLSIMAYNGLVKLHSGKYSQKYWKAFEKRKIAVELVLNNTGHDNP